MGARAFAQMNRRLHPDAQAIVEQMVPQRGLKEEECRQRNEEILEWIGRNRDWAMPISSTSMSSVHMA